jgi:ATP-dependent Lon protease
MLDTLHPAVLDRMEIIEVGGYTFDEKKHILENYLLPEAISKAGLTAEHQFEIPQKTKDYIIEYYCREPGVRSLKKYIQKICEKIAFKIVETSNSQRIVVTEDNLEDFIGTAIF